MSFEFLLGSFELGLIYALVSLGIFISFRLLDFPDLTADGSFPLGGAICGLCLYIGINPWLAVLFGTLGGCFAGVITGWLYIKLNILQLLSSIIVMIALYSINLRILGLGFYLTGKSDIFTGISNLPLLYTETIFSPFINEDDTNQTFVQFSIMLGFVIISFLLLNFFLNTQKGLALRATGTNPRMAKSQGIPTGGIVILGMAISNGLIALGGALFVQTQGGADVSIGVGTIVIGLASIIIGESIFPAKKIWTILLSVIIGTILYRLFIAIALGNELLKSIGFNSADTNLITAVIVVLALVLPKQLRKWKNRQGIRS